MDTQMKLDASLIRALREEKSWSQEHLASAAGLSTRTVQRVEAEGVGSAETRLALAAALDVPVSRLAPTGVVSANPSIGYRRGQLWGWIGWGVGAIGAFAGITNSVSTGSSSIGQTGIAIGTVCAGLGISAGVLGYLNFRLRNSRGAA
jgi:DNA-binding XRE family transcriptional regulator